MKFRLLIKIFIALLIGIAITFFVFQDQEKFKLIVKEQIQKLAKSQLGCEVDCNIKNLNLLFPSVELSDVSFSQTNDATWFWKAKKIKIKCSWLDYFFTKKFKADLQLSDLNIYSEFEKDGKISILPHIQKLLMAQNSGLPLSITFLKLNKADLELENKELQTKINLDFNSETRFTGGLKTFFYLNDGIIFNKDSQILKNISGNFQINVSNSKTSQTQFEANCICDLPLLQDLNNQCFVVGKWQNNCGNFTIKTLNGKLSIQDINIKKNNERIDLEANLNSKLSTLQKILNIFGEFACEGDVKAKLNYSKEKNNQNLNCECAVKDINCNSFNFKIDELQFNLKKENEIIQGNAIIKKNDFCVIASEFCSDEQKTGYIKLENSSDIFLDKDKKWCIKNKNLSGSCIISNDFKINGNYSLCLSNLNLDKNFTNSGKVELEKNLLKIEGALENHEYFIELLTKPNLILKNFTFFDNQKNNCIKANAKNENIELLVDYKNLRKILPENLAPPFAGEGLIKLTGRLNKNFIGKINLIDGNITISNTYNLIKNIEGEIEINFFKKCIILKNLKITLFKGSLECKQATIIFNNEMNCVEFLHLPIILKTFFLNFRKDIFVTTTGFLLFQKINNINSITGNLVIDHGLLKNNILSNEFRKEILGDQYQNIFNENKTKIDISLITKKPVRIKTEFFETQARGDLKIAKNISNPEIIGSINLSNGIINFPYKCLNIINGSIYFLQNQSYDPIINLLARNKIKQYSITMHLTGSAKNSHITFESSPPLSEEQIGTLLLVGSEKATLNVIMPTLIAQNLKNIILGSAQAHTNMKKYFDTFLKPFKYVRFVPTFTDETGRAGFKGAVEVDVNDKLRGSIEKNFSQKEDYKVEIDYDLTDDVSFKTIKDERGDLGAELEMKWKW